MLKYAGVAVVFMCLGFLVGISIPTITIGEPKIEIPGEVRGGVGRIIQVDAISASGRVQWFSPSINLDVKPIDSDSVIVTSPAGGTYDLLAWTAKGSKPSPAVVCKVMVLGEPGPGPTPPDPGPGPTPPIPPPPDNPFLVSLKAAWAKEVDPAKMSQKDKLAELYRSAAAETVKSPDLKTIGDIFGVMKKAADAVIGPQSILGVRQAISAELRKNLPVAVDAPLDGAVRDKITAEFNKVADNLGKLN